jgi:hydrogenase nickel incorporation protein HypA/HybF
MIEVTEINRVNDFCHGRISAPYLILLLVNFSDKTSTNHTMHELSIVMSVVEAATQVAHDNQAERIDAIELEIGALSGVELEALEFAWSEGVKRSLLAKAEKKFTHIPGKAECSDCGLNFPITTLYDPCPICGSYFLLVTEGRELKIKSITLDLLI